MSCWAHVEAVFRIDGVQGLWAPPDFEKLIGRECPFEAPRTTWEDAQSHPSRYLPMGSEGSLRMTVWRNPDRTSLAAYAVSVLGDLRDVEDADGIGRWFYRSCRNIGAPLRQAVCLVECDNGVEKTFAVKGPELGGPGLGKPEKASKTSKTKTKAKTKRTKKVKKEAIDGDRH